MTNWMGVGALAGGAFLTHAAINAHANAESMRGNQLGLLTSGPQGPATALTTTDLERRAGEQHRMSILAGIGAAVLFSYGLSTFMK